MHFLREYKISHTQLSGVNWATQLFNMGQCKMLLNFGTKRDECKLVLLLMFPLNMEDWM